jgi:hypothetical protein
VTDCCCRTLALVQASAGWHDNKVLLLLLLLLPLQITAEDEYAPLCTFLETLLTMMWCVQLAGWCLWLLLKQLLMTAHLRAKLCLKWLQLSRALLCCKDLQLAFKLVRTAVLLRASFTSITQTHAI